jgi:prepilin-type N-terminal cleavage/methylation domain-containing protein/prepilin-type processing-associated H-X9-DG protein
MTYGSYQRTRRAFTLIELLVVIAVISILSSILIPVLSNVRESSLAIECANDLRQMQIANMAYAQDHNGLYVPVEDLREDGDLADTPDTGGKWFANKVFYSYLTPETLNRGSWPDEFFCPTSESAGNTSITRSYGYNVTGLNSSDYELRQFRQNRINYPSKVIAFSDALDWKIQDIGADLYTNSSSPTEKLSFGVAYRHNGQLNAVFWDGHVERLSREDLVGEDNLDRWEAYE